MATSSKVQFKLSELQRRATESIDFRIANALLTVQSFDDDAALEKRINEWRSRQLEKLSTFVQELGGGQVDNYRLSKFKLDPIPEVDRYDRSRAERELAHLQNRKSQIEAKSQSIVADENGNVSLTKTQLDEFFGL